MTEQPQDAAAVVRNQLAGWVREAAELRRFAYPPVSAMPAEIRESLTDLRGRLDRMEEILVSASRLKRGTLAAQKNAEEESQDAWDHQASLARNTQQREFEGAEERYARWRLATLPAIRAARQARVLADLAAQAESEVRARFYGLRDIRGELLDRQRLFITESSLDR